jgi:hypothetical protein
MEKIDGISENIIIIIININIKYVWIVKKIL